jgi:hypothetical protein
MNARTSFGALLVIAALGAMVAGCGGSSSLSKADLDSKANSLCQTAGNKIKTIPTPSNIQDATQAAAYFDNVVPIITDVTNKLADLKPAADVKADWDAFITAQKAETAAFVSIQHKADVKDSSGLTDLAKVRPLDQAVNAAATKVGATGCSDSSSQ